MSGGYIMAHGDFYFTINATFYYFAEHWGEEGLVAYWQAMGREYLAPLRTQFQAGGLDAIARYWSDYFAEEPGGDAVVSQAGQDRVVLDVRDCPAIAWLMRSQEAATHPPPHPMYCQHCLHINQAMMEATDYDFMLEGGGGTCRQTFTRRPDASQAGGLEAIL
jgi:hypothetical protein